MIETALTVQGAAAGISKIQKVSQAKKLANSLKVAENIGDVTELAVDFEKIESLQNIVDTPLDEIVEGGLKSIDVGDLEVIEIKSPDVANKEWLVRGYDKPPYAPEYEVNVVKAGDEKYVRVFSYNADGTSNKLGGWLMKESDIKGLTPSQIAEKYALPSQPTHICDVKANPDFNLQTGIANKVEEWGNGGGQQFDTMGKFIDEDAFVNEREIGN